MGWSTRNLHHPSGRQRANIEIAPIFAFSGHLFVSLLLGEPFVLLAPEQDPVFALLKNHGVGNSVLVEHRFRQPDASGVTNGNDFERVGWAECNESQLLGLFIAGIRFRLIPAYWVLSFSGGIGAEMLVLLAVTEYSHTMTKTEQLLAKARNNPGGLSFDEFKMLLSRCGWLFDHQSGSHEIWFSPGRKRLPIQPVSNGKAKAYQIRQFLKIQDEEESNGGQV